MPPDGRASKGYRLLLRLLPRRFQEQFGAEMEEVFSQKLTAASGLLPRAWIWSRGVWDVVRTAVGLRLPERSAVGGLGRPGMWLRELRLSARGLRRAPVFAVVAIATLALGIGASVATFSIVHGALLKPLPYPDPDRLVVVWPEQNFNNAMVQGAVEAIPALDGIAGIGRWRLTLTGEGPAREVAADRVTPQFLRTLGARPALGRLLADEDALPDQEAVAVLSHGFWMELFGGDTDVLGRRIQLDGAEAQARTIVGVVSHDFRSLADEPDVWIPFVHDPAVGIAEDDTWYVNDRVARLAPGATLEQAQGQLLAFARRAQEAVPRVIEETEVRAASVTPLQPHLTRSVRTALWVTLGVVSLVLLIACANVANLLLARGDARRQDLAVRVALGAGRGGVIRMLLAESATVGMFGGLLGIALAFVILRGVLAIAPPDFPRLHEVGIDLPVLVFALAATLLATLLSGLSPALRLSGVDATSGLSGASRGGAGKRRSRLTPFLVSAEVALAVVVAVGSGLMLRSLQRMLAEDPGVEGSRVVVMSAAPPEWRYPDHASFLAYYEEALTNLRSLPGVESVGAINLLPGTRGNWSFPFYPDGVVYQEGQAAASINFRVVLPGYFETVDIPLERGRLLDASDRGDGAPVVLVNQAFVDRFWEGERALGKSVRWFSAEATPYQVVGVVGNVRQHGISGEPNPEVYVPYGQLDWVVSFWLTVRVSGNAPPLEQAASLRDGLWSVDPDVPITGINTLDAVYGESASTTRFLAVLLSGFGLLALVLCATGVFGVTAFSVGQRTSEFGVRVALGSTRTGVVEVALRSSMIPIVLGVLGGVLLALLAGRVMESSLYQIQPTDPVTLFTAASALILVGLTAAVVPAWKASRVDPVQVLAGE